MIMALHDTHFHLDLMENPRQMLEQIEQAKVYTIAVTNLPAVFDHTLQLTQASQYVRAALGFHPELASQHKNQLGLFLEKLHLSRYVGEVGLDNFNKTPADYANQKKVFESLIGDCHAAGGKILTVHSRRAEKDVISIIGPQFSGKVILHWYSGTIKDLETALSYGFYFSINHSMISSDNGKKIISQIPIDRILLETDGPFIKINNRPSTPLITHTIADGIEKLKSPKNAIAAINENFRKILTEP